MEAAQGSKARLDQALRAYGEGQIEVAERIVHDVLRSEPQNVHAMFALGMIAEARGDAAGAIQWMLEAHSQDPRFVPALERLAALFFQIGDPLNAAGWAAECLGSDPTNGECLLIKGRSFARLGLPVEALGPLHQAAERLNTPEAHLELSETYGSLNQAAKSLESAQKALALDSLDLPANLQCGRVLTQLGRLGEANRYWEKAERVERTPGQARLAKALALALSGHLDEARQAAEIAIERDPKRGKPYYVLFQSKRAAAEDELAIEQMESLLQDPQVSRADRIDLLFALGKVNDDLGRYEQAVGWFDMANRELRDLNRPGYVFDREAFRREIDSRIETFPAFPGSWGEEKTPAPIFVVGMIRSGTTLIDQILSAHPGVRSACELPYLLMHERYAVDLARRKWNRKAAYDLRDRYLTLISVMTDGSDFAVDKNPGNVLLAGSLHMLFPERPIVCTARHAVDTAISIWTTQMQTDAPFYGDREDIVFAYKQYLRLVEHWQRTIPDKAFRVFRYEDLVTEPEAQMRELLAFCGLDWDEACLHPEDNRRTVQTPSFWQVRQPVYRSSVDRWKRYEPWLGPFEELVGL